LIFAIDNKNEIISKMKEQKNKEPFEKVPDEMNDFKLFLKKKKIQNEILKKIIEKQESELNKK